MAREGAPCIARWEQKVCRRMCTPGGTMARRGHTAEIVYFRNMLATVDRPWTADDQNLADVMSSYLVNFATAGDPNHPGLPNWPRYTPGSVMALADNVGPIGTPDRAELAWFDEYFAKLHSRVTSSKAHPLVN